MNTQAGAANHISVKQIIEHVQTSRNELVREFLSDDRIQDYYKENFGRSLSKIKLEFLKRDLQGLLDSQIDLVQYSKLITDMQQSGISGSSPQARDFYLTELKSFFQKYLF